MTETEAGALNKPNLIDEMAEAVAASYVIYPDGFVSAPLNDWIDLDAVDAVDFGVLKEPHWHYHSDIRGEQYEAYIAKILKNPMKAALVVLKKRGLLNQQGLEIIERDSTK